MRTHKSWILALGITWCLIIPQADAAPDAQIDSLIALGKAQYQAREGKKARESLKAALKLRLLQSLDIAGRRVVDDQDGQAAFQPPRRFQFADYHVEATITGHAHHGTVSRRQLRAHAARQAISD